MKKTFITFFSILLTVTYTLASPIWVSRKGNDQNSGSKESPKATLTAALRQAREWRRKNEPIQDTVRIILSEGTYSLYEPLFLRPEDSGTPASPTLITAASSEKVNISGGIALKGWKKWKRELWTVDVPTFNGRPLDFRQLWINGNKAVRARNISNFEQMGRILANDPEKELLYVPAASVRAIMHAPQAEMILHEMWCIANLRIKKIQIKGDTAAIAFHQPESRIQFEHPWPRPMIMEGRNSAFYLTNAMELLDQPGEWYHDLAARKLYYYPLPGETMTNCEAIVPAIETLVQAIGTLDRPVENIIFRNLAFKHTTWMRPSLQGHVPLQAGMYLTDAYRIDPKMIRTYGNHKLDNQGWLGRPSAAVQLEATRHIDFRSCSFTSLGGSGVDYSWGCYGGTVQGCLFRDIAGNGWMGGSFSPAGHETHLPYDPTDKRELCTHQRIENNRFTNVTNEDWGCVAICAGYVSDIYIAHNEISEVSYTGISLGWGWSQTVGSMRNNCVHANHIHHYGKHMYDVAGIYTLGAQPKSSITNNAVHSIYSPSYAHDPNHWFYLYTDEGSSFITVKDNWTEGEKYLQNANGPGNLWQNNGPTVSDSIRTQAGLKPDYQHLLND